MISKLHVFGGTSDAVLLCQRLEQLGLSYGLSVATEAGNETAMHLKGKVHVGRLDAEQMEALLQQECVDLVIDATHPFAAEVSKNIIKATQQTAIKLIRYERQTQIDLLAHPLVIKVTSIEEACLLANNLGNKVFLTTGSKELATYKQLLPNKTLIARVLPTVGVLQSCVDLGLSLGEIVAMKGPFSHDLNKAMYQFYQTEVVITKESGAEGGYSEKVLPCIELGIHCIVISRPKQTYETVVSSIDALVVQLQL